MLGKKKPLSSPSQEILDSEFGHLRIPTNQEEEQSHFDPANSGQLLLPSLLKIGGSGGFVWQKGEFIVFFHFSCQTCMKSHIFHAFTPKLAANMQQSTLKEKKNEGKRVRAMDLSPKIQQST